MAKFIWKVGNAGKDGMHKVEKYLVASTKVLVDGKTQVTMKYDEATFGEANMYTSTKLRLTVQDLKLTDSDALMDGVITKMQALNKSGKAFWFSKNLSFDIGQAIEDHGELKGWQIYDAGHTFIGSRDSQSGGWDGDVIESGKGNDRVKANEGGDFIAGSLGNDKIYGGDGNDKISYQWYDVDGPGITANLAKGIVRNSDGMRDKLFSVERVRGTMENDKFIGQDGAANQFNGLKGNDNINGGKGSGDLATYYKDDGAGGTNGIKANLKTGKIIDGFGDTDTVTGIENVRGTAHNDRFVDNAKVNGFQGDGGNDTFIFTRGDDWAIGGSGADTFIYKGAFGVDWIGDFSQSEGDKIKIAGAKKFSALTITDDEGRAAVTFGDNVVLLNNVSASDLSASDFLF